MNRSKIFLALLALAAAAFGQQASQEGPQERKSERRLRWDGQGRGPRWAAILEDAPVLERLNVGKSLQGAEAQAIRSAVSASQQSVRAELASGKAKYLGSVNTVLNAVFFSSTEAEAERIASLPGVKTVVPMPAMKRMMNRALDLVRAPQAWNIVGGQNNAGAGVKIAIMDSGVDIGHPALQDTSLPAVPGAPFCRGADCSYTNQKVIAARSYVEQLAYNYPEDTRPDDTTPRDRVGHGTAVAMIAAGIAHQGPLGTMSGVAPKAYIGNYKIYGSPGVNDLTFTDVLITAIEDAINDGMDILIFSTGFVAEWGPADAGVTCDRPDTTPCDPRATAVRNAIDRGLTVVTPAGNDGDAGMISPSFNTIASPGTEPRAITVGASTNSHTVFQSLRVQGNNVPGNLQQVNGRFGNGPVPGDTLTGPIRDVTSTGDNGQACSPLGNNSMQGAIALIQSGGCTLEKKIRIAAQASAIGVVFMRPAGQNTPFPATGLMYTPIPMMMIGNADGANLREYVRNNPNTTVILNPRFFEAENDNEKYADFVAAFSSLGPSIRTNGIKPELLAPGTNLLVATQTLDPNGDMWDQTGFRAVQGASFAAPMVAGAAAMVKQRNPGWGPAQLKSAVVNTANPNVDDFDAQGSMISPAFVTAMGAGKLNAEAALQTNVTVDPAVVSFGAITAGGSLPSASLTFRNNSAQLVTLTLQVQARNAPPNTQVTVNPSTFSLGAGATSGQVSVRVEGNVPGPGSYEGVLLVTGGAVALRIPYLYVVGDGVPANVIPMNNYDFTGLVGQRLPGAFTIKVVDRYGVPVPNVNVAWRSTVGGGQIVNATRGTDDLGIAEAWQVTLGPQIGEQVFVADVTGYPQPIEFIGNVRQKPAISTGGVVNAASNETRAVAPGSYVSIYGSDLADFLASYKTKYLPLAISNVSVGVDVPGQQLSYPARLHFISPGQINVQLPWELEGLSNANIKVSIGDFSSATYNFQIANTAPAPFPTPDPGTGRTLAIAQFPSDGGLATEARPAPKGAVMVVYANGLGPVNNRPGTGEPSPGPPLLADTRFPVTATVAGRSAPVSFSGLTPGFVGLYQVNLQIPTDAPSGLQDLILTVNGVSSTPMRIPIQ